MVHSLVSWYTFPCLAVCQVLPDEPILDWPSRRNSSTWLDGYDTGFEDHWLWMNLPYGVTAPDTMFGRENGIAFMALDCTSDID